MFKRSWVKGAQKINYMNCVQMVYFAWTVQNIYFEWTMFRRFVLHIFHYICLEKIYFANSVLKIFFSLTLFIFLNELRSEKRTMYIPVTKWLTSSAWMILDLSPLSSWVLCQHHFVGVRQVGQLHVCQEAEAEPLRSAVPARGSSSLVVVDDCPALESIWSWNMKSVQLTFC
jgi:hypothetical protein